MTAFRVERPPASFYKFQELLKRYADDANAIKRYLEKAGDHEIWSGWGNAGLIHHAEVHHEANMKRARERLDHCHVVATKSSSAIFWAASFYEKTDDAAAAKLDATYPPAEHAPVRERAQVDGHAIAFDDQGEPEQCLTEPDGGDLIPKASEVEKWMEKVDNWANGGYWARKIAKEIVGRDIPGELIEIFSGDWKELAKYADMMRNCGEALTEMHHNVEHCPDSLGLLWEGNAADAAIAHFKRFAKATEAEIGFYSDHLFAIYREYVESAFHAYQMLSAPVDDLIDALTVFGSIKKASKLAAQIVNIAAEILSVINQTKTIFEVIRANSSNNIPPEPPCLMSEIVVWEHLESNGQSTN